MNPSIWGLMSTIICIDYGTGMSKAAFSIDGGSPFPVPLGQCEGDTVTEFLIDSSLLFASDGQIYLGTNAIRKSYVVQNVPQRRLDSLKRRLTTGELNELDKVPLPHAFNQTGINFSLAEALTLMFAHILRLTHDYLREQYDDGVLDSVVYRFTRPVYDSARGEWVDRHMTGAIAAGLKLERQLGKFYAASIDARLARSLLDVLKHDPPSHECICRDGLPEPVAAGILVLSQIPNRRFLAAIMDIGAGTTDIALFAGVQPAGRPSVDRVRTYGTPVSVTKAGDYIDGLLTKMIEDGSNGKLNAESHLEIELSIRRWKEDIFKFQETIPTLSGGRLLSRITQHRFIGSEDFQAMEREWITSLFGVFKSAERIIDNFATNIAPPLFRPVDAIEIIPCGGGAKLPVFMNIAARYYESHPSGRRLGFEVHNPVPADGGNYDESFPQLAVALGGALSDQPVVNGPAPILEVRR